jgi:hypothetical protein
MFHLLFENFDQEHNSDQLAISVESKCKRFSASSYTERIAIFFLKGLENGGIRNPGGRNYAVTNKYSVIYGITPLRRGFLRY